MGFSLVNCAMCLRAPIPDVVVLSHCEAIILRFFFFAMLKIHFPTHLMRLSVDNVDRYWFEISPAVSSAWCDFSFLHAQLTTQITIANIRRVVEIQKKFKTKRTKTIFIFCLRDASFYFDVRGTSQTIVAPVEEKGNCVLLKSFNIRVISRLTNLCIYIEYMCTVEVPSQTMMLRVMSLWHNCHCIICENIERHKNTPSDSLLYVFANAHSSQLLSLLYQQPSTRAKTTLRCWKMLANDVWMPFHLNTDIFNGIWHCQNHILGWHWFVWPDRMHLVLVFGYAADIAICHAI